MLKQSWLNVKSSRLWTTTLPAMRCIEFNLVCMHINLVCMHIKADSSQRQGSRFAASYFSHVCMHIYYVCMLIYYVCMHIYYVCMYICHVCMHTCRRHCHACMNRYKDNVMHARMYMHRQITMNHYWFLIAETSDDRNRLCVRTVRI